MGLDLRERLPSTDPILDILYGSGNPGARGASQAAGAGPAGGGLFPGGHFRSDEAALRRLAHLDRPPRGGLPRRPRDAQALLAGENAFAPLHPAQEVNLDLAGKHGTVFLLTGQQPGLLGGPVLWYYKALTCIALAEESTRRLGLPVVPVFWVAGDDSDLKECNHLELLEELPPGLPSASSLPFPEPERALPMGARPVDAAAVESLLGRLAAVWGPGTLEAVRASRPGEGTLVDAFLRLAHRRLGPRGMLFLNGYSRAVRLAARPVLERAVREWRSIQSCLERGTAALQAAGIHPPVVLREGVVHAFALRDGERRRIYAEGPAAPGAGAPGSGLAASGIPGSDAPGAGIPGAGGRSPGRVYTVDRPGVDLLPGLGGIDLTHDVFTRPLVADSLLPVLGHVLGPAELRYFAQMAPVFLEETGGMPLVHPRMAAAVMTGAAARGFAGRGISPAEALSLKPSDLRQRLQDRAWKSHPAAADLPAEPPRELLDGLRRSHLRHFHDTGPLERLERSLQGAWRRYLRSLGRMAYDAEPESRALAGPLRWLGLGAGQDRHLNLHSLLDLVGEEGLDRLADLLLEEDPTEPGIRLFTWSPPEAGAGARLGKEKP